MSLTLKDFSLYEKGMIGPEEVIECIAKNPTSLEVLEKQMQSHEELFLQIQDGVNLYNGGNESMFAGVSLSDTLMKKTDVMKYEPNMTQAMTQRIEEMRSFIRENQEIILTILAQSKDRIAILLKGNDCSDN